MTVLPDVHILNGKTFSDSLYRESSIRFTYFFIYRASHWQPPKASLMKFTSVSRAICSPARLVAHIKQNPEFIASDTWPRTCPDFSPTDYSSIRGVMQERDGQVPSTGRSRAAAEIDEPVGIRWSNWQWQRD